MKEEEKKDVPDESGVNELVPTKDERKSGSVFSEAKKVLLKTVVTDAAQVGKKHVSLVKEEFEKFKLKEKFEKASGETKQFLDESGITDKASKAYKETQEHLDSVSGAKTLALVEERLAIQEQYNNILATKLHEALQRIERLEDRLARRDSS